MNEELNALNKLADLFETETKKRSSKMYYIEAVYRKDIEYIEKTTALHFPLLNFEMQAEMDVENTLGNKDNITATIRIYIIFKAGQNNDIQIGRIFKNKKSILAVYSDIRSVLKENIQASGYWTQLTLSGSGKVELEGENNIYIGRYIDVDVNIRNV